MFETAFRAAYGMNIVEHRKKIGKLFEHYSNIASKNPYAWSHKSYSAEQIITPSPENRAINHPYTKRMCSNMFVDHSAAVIMTSDEIADKLGIKREKWVYIMGGADLRNVHEISQRPNIYDSPASREGSRLALSQAGLTIEDINGFDLYSCFPSIVEIMKKEIGIPDDDPRDLTLTGGNVFFGGPWSLYSLHGIVSAVDLIRKNPDSKLMVVANGGYNTKQSFGIYGIQPPVISWSDRDDIEIQAKILADKLPEPIEKAEGELKIDAYTITYDRDGNPKEGIVLGTLKNGHRTYAFIRTSPEVLSKLENQELVGQDFTVLYDTNIDRNVITNIE